MVNQPGAMANTHRSIEINTDRRKNSLKQNVNFATAKPTERVQENMIKGGLTGRNAKGKRTITRAINGIDGDIKLNRALWMIAEKFKNLKS